MSFPKEVSLNRLKSCIPYIAHNAYEDLQGFIKGDPCTQEFQQISNTSWIYLEFQINKKLFVTLDLLKILKHKAVSNEELIEIFLYTHETINQSCYTSLNQSLKNKAYFKKVALKADKIVFKKLSNLLTVLEEINQRKMSQEKECLNQLSVELSNVKKDASTILANYRLSARNYEAVFTKLINLLYNYAIFSFSEIYLCLYSCGSDILLDFTGCESRFFSNVEKTGAFDDVSHFSTRKMFLHCINCKSHFLSIIYDFITYSRNGNNFSPNDSILMPLLLFADLVKLSKSHEKLCILPVLLSFLEENPMLDGYLMNICKQKFNHLTIAKWCLSVYPDVNIHKLMTLLANHSSLYALNSCLPLFNISYKDVLNILSSSMDENLHSGYASLLTFQGFFLLQHIFHILSSGIELDRAVTLWQEKRLKICMNRNILLNHIKERDYEACRDFYAENVACKWSTVINILMNIKPICYRLEILEDIFSLIFLNHTNCSDDLNLSFDECDNNSGVGYLSLDEHVSGSVSDTWSEFNSAEEYDSFRHKTLHRQCLSAEDCKFKEEQIDSSDLIVYKDGLGKNPYLQILATTTTSDLSSCSNICDFSKRGYLINSLVAWDILLVLHEVLLSSLEEYDSKVFSHEGILCSAKCHDLPERQYSLQQKVYEGICRLQILCDKFHKIGSIEEIKEFMTGILFSNKVDKTLYEQVKTDWEIMTTSAVPIFRNKYKKEVSGNLRRPNVSIVNLLLASPKYLLSSTLRRSMIQEAEELVSKYQLSHHIEAKELQIINKWEEFLLKFKNHFGGKSPHIMASSENLIPHEIGADNNRMYDESILLQNLANAKNQCGVSISDIGHTNILVDLAVTNSVQLQFSKKLINHAIDGYKLFTQLDKYSKFGFVQKLNTYWIRLSRLSCIGNKSDHTFRVDYHTDDFSLIGNQLSLQNILLNVINTETDLIIGKSLSDVISSLCSISSVCLDHQSVELYSVKAEKLCQELHSMCKNLLKATRVASLVLLPKSKVSARRKDGEAHMWSFLNYLNLLNYTCTKFSITSKESSSLHLNVINQKPIHFLSDILFKDGVDPSCLEPLCSRMQIDLLSIISQTTCYPVPFAASLDWWEVLSSAKLASIGCVKFEGKFILNGGEMTGEGIIQGEIAGRDILTALLDAVSEILTMDSKSKKFYTVAHESGDILAANKDIQGILLSTAELASSDLKHDSANELIVFYINLANLMILHAGILNFLIFGHGPSGLFAESPLERGISITLVGYVIGQLGFISLYDILHKIIGLPVIDSFLDKELLTDNIQNDYLQSRFPDFSILLVSQAVQFSPKISVFFSDSFETDANTVIASYLGHLIDPQWRNSKGKMFATQEILSFLKSKEWSLQFNSLMKLVSSDYFEYLHILKLKSQDNLSLGSNFPSRIIINVQDDSTFVDGLPPAIVTTAEVKSLHLINLKVAPNCIQNYVSENSLILHVIIGTICSGENSTVDMLTNKIWSYKTKKFYFEYISHLVCLPRVLSVSSTFDMLINNVAISIIPELNLCIKKLERIFNCEHKQNSLLHLAQAFKLIECLPSLALLKYPHLDCINENLTLQILNAESQDEHSQYWNIVYGITNSIIMYKSGRQNYKKWPINPVYHWLCFLLSNSKLNQDHHYWAFKKIEQVLCYQKIVDCNAMEVTRWQDVYGFSRSDPLDMVRHLMKNEKYTLIVEWSRFHDCTDRILFFVNQSKLNLYLEGNPPNMDAVGEMLMSLEMNRFLCTVGVLLYQRQNMSCRKLLIEHLLRRIAPGDATQVEGFEFDLFSLRQELIALILIEDVAPSDDRAQLISVSTKPYLIVEQWLMNMKVSLVEKGLTMIADHLDQVLCLGKEVVEECLCWNHFNLVVEHYANKAMEICHIVPLLSDQRVAASSVKHLLPSKAASRADWQLNDSATSCCACDTVVFSLFNRRHHCRRCGRVICYECSLHRGTVAGYGDSPVRICKDCYYSVRKAYVIEHCGSSRDKTTTSNVYGWHLSSSSSHNTSVRRDFTYDHVPSVNLCQSLLSLHSNELHAATYVLTMAADAIATITDFDLVAHPSTDTNFLLNMLHTLLSYGKVRFSNVASYRGVAACEYYIMWIAILKMVDKYSVGGLLLHKCLENMRVIGTLWVDELRGIRRTAQFHARLDKERCFMRIMRDSFVSRQMWQLALDVATKTGLETTGVWGAWGMASLKGGDFKNARDCFGKVLKPTDNKHHHSSHQSNSLLNEILTFLQSKPFDTAYFNVDCCGSSRQTSTAIVRGSLNGLSDILSGNQSSPEHMYDKQLSLCFKTECEYYLHLYGCHETNVRFFIANKDLKLCLNYIYRNDVRPIIFVQAVLMTAFKVGEIFLLLDTMRSLNQLMWYEKTILFSCHWLEVNNHSNCLFQLQKYLGDYLRGGISLIKMYVEEADSFATIHSRKHYLLEAEELLKKYLQKNIRKKLYPRNVKNPQLVMQLPIWNVHRQLRLIRTQINSAAFLAHIERSRDSVRSVVKVIHKHFSNLSYSREVSGKPVSSVPTVFQSQERIVLAIVVAVVSADLQGAIDFCYELVEMNSVSAQHMLQFVPTTLLLMRREKLCMTMIKGIFEWGLVPPSEVKKLLLPALFHAAKLDNQQSYEQLMKFIPTMDEKVNLYIHMGRYKSAYLAIVQQNSMANMANLLSIAQEKDNLLVVNLCSKWIKSHEELKERAIAQLKLEATSAGKRIKKVNFSDETHRRLK